MRHLFACLVLVGCASTTPVTCDADGYHCRDRALTSAELGAVCPTDGAHTVLCSAGEAQCHSFDPGMPFVNTSTQSLVCDDAGHLSLK